MGFLGKNINLALIGLILVLVLVATGSTVLYQRSLQQRTDQFETTSLNLSECRAALENYMDVLEERESELNETSQDIAKYDTLYGQKVSELESKKDELDATQADLNSMTLQKEQFKELYSKALLNISSLAADIEDLEDDVAVLQSQKQDLKDDLDACEAAS